MSKIKKEHTTMPKTTWVGEVVSDKMHKTVVVSVVRVYKHPLFGKVLKAVKKYKVHDPLTQAKVGDIVEFFEGKPVSKSKFMYLSKVVKKADSELSAKSIEEQV